MSHIQSQQIANKFKAKYPIMLFPLRIESRFMRIGSDNTGPWNPAELELEVLIKLINGLEDPVITRSPGGIKKVITEMSNQYDRFLTTLKANTRRGAALPMRSNFQQWKLTSIWAKWKNLAPILTNQNKKGIKQIALQSELNIESLNTLKDSMTFEIGKVSNLPTSFFASIQEKVDQINQLTKYTPSAPELSLDILMERMLSFDQNVKAIHDEMMGLSLLSASDHTRLFVLVKEVFKNGLVWANQAQEKISIEIDFAKSLNSEVNKLMNTHEEIMARYGPSDTDLPYINSWIILEMIRQNISQIEKRKENLDLISIHQLITENTNLLDEFIQQVSDKKKQSAYNYMDSLALMHQANQLQTRLVFETEQLVISVSNRRLVNEEISKSLIKFVEIPTLKGTPSMEFEELNSVLKLYQQIKYIFNTQKNAKLTEFISSQAKLTVLLKQFAHQLFYRDSFSIVDSERFNKIVLELVELHEGWNSNISNLVEQVKNEAGSLREVVDQQVAKSGILNKAHYGNEFNARSEAWGHQYALDQLLEYLMTPEGIANISGNSSIVAKMKEHVNSLSVLIPTMDYFPESLKFSLYSTSGKLYAWSNNERLAQENLLEKITKEFTYTEEALGLLDEVKKLPVQRGLKLSLDKELHMVKFYEMITKLEIATNYDYSTIQHFKQTTLLKNRIFKIINLFSGIKTLPADTLGNIFSAVDNFIAICQERLKQLVEQYSPIPWSKGLAIDPSILDSIIAPYIGKDPKLPYYNLWKLNAKIENLAKLVEVKSSLDISPRIDIEVLAIQANEFNETLDSIKLLPPGIKGIFNKTQQKVKKILDNSIYQLRVILGPLRFAVYQFESHKPQLETVNDIKIDRRLKSVDSTSKTSLSSQTDSLSKFLVQNTRLMNIEEQMYASLDIVNSINKVAEQIKSISKLSSSDQQALVSEVKTLLNVYKQWNSQTEKVIAIEEDQIDLLEEQSNNIFSKLSDSSDTMASITGRNIKLSLSPKGPIGEGPRGPNGPGGPSGPGDPGDPGNPPVDSEEHELWIRAYPDDIAIDAHEPALTEDEIESGIAYWTEVWYALNNREKELGAWRALTSTYGPERAAWIVKVLTPTNISQKPNPFIYAEAIKVKQSLSFTEKDLTVGTKFWSSVLRASESPKDQEGLWKNLSGQYPNGKANLLAQATKPEKLYKIFAQKTIAKSIEPQITASKLSNTPNVLAAPVSLSTASNNIQTLIAALQTPIPSSYVFPVFSTPDTRPQSWNNPAKTHILPDQLVFILYKGEEKIAEVIGNNIPSALTVGINPADDQTFDPTSNGDLNVGPELNWMFDFDDAISKGMAVKIPITDEEADPNNPDSGFTRVLVVGIKHTADTTQSKDLVENLFDSHHYVDEGMSFIAPGTPTNNNGDSKSDFNVFDDNDEKSFATEVNGSLFNNTSNSLNKTDGQLLSEVLGIDSSVFKNIHGSDRKSIRNVEVANTSFWAGTLGFYLEEMYDFAGKYAGHIFNLPEDLDTIRAHFIKFVKSRGALPSLRIGSQPYGILPVSALYYRSWEWSDEDTPFNQLLIDLLIKRFWGAKNPTSSQSMPTATRKWNRVVQEDLRSVDDPLDLDDNVSDLEKLVAAQERFMNLLGLTATSSSFYNRYLLSGSNSDHQDLFVNGSNFTTWLNFAHTFQEEFTEFIEFGDFPPQYGTSTEPYVGYRGGTMFDRLRGVNNHSQLLGPTVDKYKASPDRQLAKDDQSQNYIQWLLNQEIKDIHQATIEGESPSNSILFLMLRQALLSQYWDAAMKIYDSIDLRDFRYYAILNEFNRISGLDWRTVNQIDLYDLSNEDVNKYQVIVDLVGSLITKETEDEFIPDNVEEYLNTPLVDLINWYPNSHTTDLHRHSYKWFVAGVKDLGEGDGFPDDRIPEENELVIAGNRWPFLFFNFDHLDLPGLTTGQEVTMAEYMTQGFAAQHFPDEMANVQEFITNMNLLAQLSTQELESLMVEHIDTCSHRLDTWLLSLVNKRVEKLRDGNTNNKGLHIGAFGWVLDLKPGQTRTDLSGSPIVYNADTDGSEVPIANDPDNQGFIHAPSLNHAVTAAVLKAGYNATGRNELLEVNLSSARVRKAMFYIEGVRNGQNLGALLGYQFERGLHDNNSEELDQYILEMRKAFPLVADILLDSNASESIETIQANQVIDGLKLLEHMRETPYPYGIYTLPSASSAEGLAIIAEVKNMEGDLDAVGDLALAEGVYQVTQGNYTRSNAMMKAVSEGSFIPQPEIINTPRTGQNLTHRSIISMTPVSDGTKPEFWPARVRGRTKAEQTFNNWLAGILGKPNLIQCFVYITRSSTPDTPLRKVVNLRQLGLQPTDLMYAMNTDFKGSQSLLYNRIARRAIQNIELEEGEEILKRMLISY